MLNLNETGDLNKKSKLIILLNILTQKRNNLFFFLYDEKSSEDLRNYCKKCFLFLLIAANFSSPILIIVRTSEGCDVTRRQVALIIRRRLTDASS